MIEPTITGVLWAHMAWYKNVLKNHKEPIWKIPVKFYILHILCIFPAFNGDLVDLEFNWVKIWERKLRTMQIKEVMGNQSSMGDILFHASTNKNFNPNDNDQGSEISKKIIDWWYLAK